MNQSLKKHLIKSINEKIELNYQEYGNNFIASKANSEIDTDEARVKVDSAEHNMIENLKRIQWLENLKKSLE